MKRRISLYGLLLLLGLAAQAAPTLRLSIDRTRIYLGESVIANVSLEGSRSDRDIPVFASVRDDEIEYLGSRDTSSHQLIFINGRASRNDFEGRVFVFRITPAAAGVFETGAVTVRTPEGTARASGARIEVTGVETRPDISASVTCADETVLVDGPFTIVLSVVLRALPAPNEAIEPILPGQPLHLEASYLDGPEVKGLDPPDLAAALNGLVSRRPGREPSFTINGYRQRGMLSSFFDFGGDPFAERPIPFRLPPKRVARNGTNYWEYALGLTYTPRAEGDYIFGPVTVKGALVTGARADGTARVDEVFVVGPAVTVRVIPPPEEGRPDCFIGSVGKAMRAAAALDTSRCKVGDPLTLTLDLTGDVSVSNMKPPLLSLQPNRSDDFRIYDDNIESASIDGGKRFTYRVRPLRAGTLEFPSIHAAYYDTARRAYVTVATDPMPLQVEETTRIAATSGGADGADGDALAGGASAASRVPDGIFLAAADAPPRCRARGAGALLALLAGAPALWLLVVALRALAGAFRARRARGALGRRAAANLRAFENARRRAAQAPAEAAAAATGAVRVALAAKLGLETVSLTTPEMRAALGARGVPPETVGELCEAFDELERLSYVHEADGGPAPAKRIDRLGAALARVLSALKVLAVVLLFLGASPRAARAADRAPDPFDWERAGQTMASAATEEAFLGAAAQYYAMVTNGAASGPLLYNLGTALLLAGEKGAAAEALIAAERRLGTADEVADNLRLALADAGESGALPVSRVFLFWHYGPSFATRIDLAVLGWTVFWLAAAAVALLGKGRGVRLPRAFLRLVAGLALALFALYGASVALTALQIRVIDLPRTAAVLARPDVADIPGEEVLP